MRRVCAVVVLALGFFALVVQTVLFRVFLISFEGNELGVGVFFGSWLLWVALGALAGRRATRWSHAFPMLVLLYIPAFLVQHALTTHARNLVGVASYELFPFVRMIGLSLLTNAPVSFMTGFLFTLACVWWETAGKEPASEGDERTSPIAAVYIFETLGAFLGGVAVTLMLAKGVSAETVAIVAALVLAAGVACVWRPPLLRFVPVTLILIGLLSGLGERWAEWNGVSSWSRLLPVEAYQGQFTTPQGKYLYGQREEQFIVMSGGGVGEALPNTEHASEVAALNLAQHPEAARVLVFGPGSLSICMKLVDLLSIEQVTWLHPDPEYPGRIMDVLPKNYRPDAEGIEIPMEDIRTFAETSATRYDLIILNLPDATTLLLNRYSTREALASMKGLLNEGGVMSMRLSGAANFLGGELAYLGAAALITLESLFEHVVLKPGDESWLIASDSAKLTETPAKLRDRFAQIEGGAAIYPPEGLISLYLPDRIAFQKEAYRGLAGSVDESVLANTDRRPNALLYSLLIMLRRLGVKGFVERLPVWFNAGVWVLACAVLIYGVMRMVYLFRSICQSAVSASFDGQFLVFSTGMAGMSLSVLLMFMFQSRFGSLYLHVGLLNALFMLGSFLGSLLCVRALRLLPGTARPVRVTMVLVAVHIALLVAIWMLPVDTHYALFAVLFVCGGMCTGMYFPLGSHGLIRGGVRVAAGGARLEMSDHLGGAFGAVLTGLCLLPVLGSGTTLLFLGLLVAVNLVPLAVPERIHQATDRFDKLMRPAGYVMFGIGAYVLLSSQIVAAFESGQEGKRLLHAAREMTGVVELTQRQKTLTDGRTFGYFATFAESDEPESFVFSTSMLAGDVYGYGGPITLAVSVSRDGTLENYRIIDSNETPAYLELLYSWNNTLLNRNLASAQPFDGVDGVSGATLTSEAVMKILKRAGGQFASQVLGIEVATPAPFSRSSLCDRDFVCLAILVAAAVALRFRPHRWTRRVFLLVAMIAAGLCLNLQYSMQHVMTLLSLNLPQMRLSGPFFMVVLVPLLTLLVGNVYCGYVCPFGALQELVGDLRPKRLATEPSKNVWRYGRAVKYGLLLLFVAVFSYTREYTVLSADPLITLFSVVRENAIVCLAGAALFLSLFYHRFWCRNLCPVGAFLSLLNNARLIRRLAPPSRTEQCDLGVRNAQELDCIRCDRCWHETK